MAENTDDISIGTRDSLGRVRILLVDDSSMFLASAREFLSAFPFLSIEGSASSGGEALEKMKSLVVDLVLMDFFMPGIDGMGAARSIKTTQPSSKIVIMSVYSHLADWLAAEGTFVDGFIDKSEFGSSVIPLIQRLFHFTKN